MKNALGFIFLACVFLASPAYSCNLSNSDLPEEVKKSIEAECLKKEAEMISAERKGLMVEENTPERISEYANIAGQVSQALVVAARELGVAANDFMQTPAGLLVVFVILFKVLGDTLLAIAGAVLVHYMAGKLLRHLWYKQGEPMEVTRSFLWWSRTSRERELIRVTYRDQEEFAVFWSLAIVATCAASVFLVVLVS